MSERSDCTDAVDAVAVVPGERVSLLQGLNAADSRLLVYAVEGALQAEHAVDLAGPHVLILDEDFTKTGRGAALVSRARAAACSTIRILSARDYDELARDVDGSLPHMGRPLPADYAGSQGVPRVAVAETHDARLDQERARLINLSSTGAQVLTSRRLLPGVRVQFRFQDVRCSAIVVWSIFEPGGTVLPSSYRAGLRFLDPDTTAVAALRARLTT